MTLSLVAVHGGKIIGHIAFSPVKITDGSQDWYGLGPVAVLPDHQANGTGAKLVLEGLRKLGERNARGCVLLGDPGYYTRFGFTVAEGLVLEGVPPEYFMAL